MTKTELKEKFPLVSFSEEEVSGAKIAAFSFMWTVRREFMNLSDYPGVALALASAQRLPRVLIEARTQIVGDGNLVLGAMEIFFDLRPLARTLGVEIGGPGRAGFSAEENYLVFLTGLVASMEAVVAQCKTVPGKRGRRDTEERLVPEIRKLAEDFASSSEWKDRDEARARFLILALDNFPD